MANAEQPDEKSTELATIAVNPYVDTQTPAVGTDTPVDSPLSPSPDIDIKPVPKDAAPTPAPNPTANLDPAYRWWALSSVVLAILLASSQSSALIIAFPDLMLGLDAGLLCIMFVLIAYMIVIAALVLPIGGISDIIGRKIMYNVGFTIFTISCLLCGFSQKSQNGWDLVSYRCIQGVGAACIFANSAAILTDAFAPWKQVGLAMGAFQVTSAVGSILGPLIGGGLHNNWIWIFMLNVPIGAVGTAIGFWKMREAPPKAGVEKPRIITQFINMDWIGILLLIGGFVMFLLALTAEALEGLLTTGQSVALYVVGLSMLIALVVYDLKFCRRTPVIQFKMFSASMFSIAMFNGLLTAFARGIVLFAALFLFQGPYASTPFQAGVYTIPFGGGILVSGLVSGRIADKSGPRVMQVVGPVIAGAGAIGIGFIKIDTSLAAPLCLLFVVGFGVGIYNSPNSMAGMLAVEPRYRGVASGFQTALLMFGQILALITLFGILTHSVDQAQLFAVFLVGGGGANMGPVLVALQKCYFITVALFWFAAVLHLVYNLGSLAKHKKEARTAAGST